MSETMLTLSNPYDTERRPGSVGMVVPGFEARIVDAQGEDVPVGQPGELWVRGVGLMRGYWQDSRATEVSFTGDWFHTGDVAERDADGYHRLLGRRSVDIIKSGGFKISPREIEEVIATLPLVREVAVVGLSDPKWGQRIVAAVAPAQPNADPEALAAAVMAHVAEQLLIHALLGEPAQANWGMPWGLPCGVPNDLPQQA